MIKNGCGQSGQGTLKLTVFSRMNRWNDFASWCTFRKGKSYLNDFLAGVVKNECDHVVYQTLKFVVS